MSTGDDGRGLDINESDLAEVGDRHDEICGRAFSRSLLCGERVSSVGEAVKLRSWVVG